MRVDSITDRRGCNSRRRSVAGARHLRTIFTIDRSTTPTVFRYSPVLSYSSLRPREWAYGQFAMLTDPVSERDGDCEAIFRHTRAIGAVVGSVITNEEALIHYLTVQKFLPLNNFFAISWHRSSEKQKLCTKVVDLGNLKLL